MRCAICARARWASARVRGAVCGARARCSAGAGVVSGVSGLCGHGRRRHACRRPGRCPAAGARLGQVALMVGQLQQRVRGHDVPARPALASVSAYPRPAARLRPGGRGRAHGRAAARVEPAAVLVGRLLVARVGQRAVHALGARAARAPAAQPVRDRLRPAARSAPVCRMQRRTGAARDGRVAGIRPAGGRADRGRRRPCEARANRGARVCVARAPGARCAIRVGCARLPVGARASQSAAPQGSSSATSSSRPCFSSGVHAPRRELSRATARPPSGATLPVSPRLARPGVRHCSLRRPPPPPPPRLPRCARFLVHPGAPRAHVSSQHAHLPCEQSTNRSLPGAACGRPGARE